MLVCVLVCVGVCWCVLGGSVLVVLVCVGVCVGCVGVFVWPLGEDYC